MEEVDFMPIPSIYEDQRYLLRRLGYAVEVVRRGPRSFNVVACKKSNAPETLMSFSSEDQAIRMIMVIKQTVMDTLGSEE